MTITAYTGNGRTPSPTYDSASSGSVSDFESRVAQYHIETNTASLVRIGALKPGFGLVRHKESGLVSDKPSEK
ncbi:Uncharacterised protein [uncultured archaeon]|nr:Uncharacterised protein [uncultured archaeon]